MGSAEVVANTKASVGLGTSLTHVTASLNQPEPFGHAIQPLAESYPFCLPLPLSLRQSTPPPSAAAQQTAPSFSGHPPSSGVLL